ncbi:MAG: exodeoxyribonuclease VII large subunit, partial [Betaproteobacteria bacterium]|nr:exodeoxyribonuclease VII large subunit [Betaproteobacteria bacterium]
LVLARGYAWLSDAQGRSVASAHAVHAGQTLQAQLHDGRLTVQTLSAQVK